MEKMAFLVAVVVIGVAAMCYATFRFISNEINILKTTICTGKEFPSRLYEEYVNSLFNQIRTAANQISEVRVENLKLRSDLERDKIIIEEHERR